MYKMRTSFVLITIVLAIKFKTTFAEPPKKVWGYVCEDQRCKRVQITTENLYGVKALPVCRMFCRDTLGHIWPKPREIVSFDESLVTIDPSKIQFNVPNSALWDSVKARFLAQLSNKIKKQGSSKLNGNALQINIGTAFDLMSMNSTQLLIDTDESYKLSITYNNKSVDVTINSNSFFGSRHGIETLSQLIVYDDLFDNLKILRTAEINDGPAYKWRGLVLDTSRNFFSLNTIKTILDGMAMSKLNTFHWHITDSHSFPFEVKSHPDLHRLGAYDFEKIYSHEEIEDTVKYALVRGIRVVPEFDAPAHVGEGWQNLNMTVCFNAQPWENYCVEPPCGQLNPTVPELYDVLENIYREMVTVFQPDVFHMGGDEVSVNCWNSSRSIQEWMTGQGWGLTETDFMRLWNYFQEEALKRYDKINNSKETPVILWTSRLTDSPYIEKYLDPKRHIIQIWTTAEDPKIQNILKLGFRTIISNYDALYLDCGGPGWVKDGQNWCSPYHGWQKVYSNNMNTFSTDFKGQILGAEAAIWSEQIDDFSVLPRIFPRVSALAENLWTNLNENWRAAESRMLLHRDLLVQNHIPAEALQPQWCLQNENDCPVRGY